MGGSVLAVTLLSALNPVRLALTVLVVSRPRPLQNLVAFWAGCVTGSIPSVMIPLTLVHVTSMADSVEDAVAAGPTSEYLTTVLGVLALTVAAVMILRSRMLQRQAATQAAGTGGRHRQGGTGATMVVDRDPPLSMIERLLGQKQQYLEGGSVFPRLLRSLTRAWENGALWVTFVIGLAFAGPQPDVSLLVVALIVASGAAIGAQIASSVVFVLGTMGFIEMVLLGYLITPAGTQAAVRVLHDWVSAHRRKIVISMLAVVGVVLVAQGMGVAG